MILQPSENDRLALLEAMEIERNCEPLPQSYANCVVLKPWGHEFEMFADARHGLWMLKLIPGRATSLHCHLHKTAKFIPLTNGISLVTLRGVIPLVVGEPITAEPKVFHSVWNSSPREAALLEVETPSIKSDLIRVSDAHGREKRGYEGEGSIVRHDLERYEHGRLTEDCPLVRWGHEIAIEEGGFWIRRLEHAS